MEQSISINENPCLGVVHSDPGPAQVNPSLKLAGDAVLCLMKLIKPWLQWIQTMINDWINAFFSDLFVR